MTLFFTALLTLAAFGFIVYPFFREKRRVDKQAESEKVQELRSERDTTYSMLKELEFDYQSGILTEEDYKELEARYKRKAISTLRQLDDVSREGASATETAEAEDDEIEQQVRKLRQGRSAGARPAPQTASQPAAKPAARNGNKFCTNCGQGVREGDKFCANCGAGLK